MANYVIAGKSAGGSPLFSIAIGSVDQDEMIVDDLDVVNAVRAFAAAVPGVSQVVAQKYAQVITVV